MILVLLFWATGMALPHHWTTTDGTTAYWYYAFICSSSGLVSGFLIGLSTDYYTSNAYRPV